MKDVIITDLTGDIENKEKVPIELVSCLQQKENREETYIFLYSRSFNDRTISNFKELSKVATNVVEGMDLILVNKKFIFLGRWNDGVI